MSEAFAPVRLAPERVVEAAAVMGRALRDDPLFVYALPDDAQRQSGVHLLMEMSLRFGLAHGEVWSTPPPITGVAEWRSPSHPRMSEEERDAAGWREVGAAWGAEAFARFQEFAVDMAGFAGTVSQEPHWHLSWLCVDPAQQGQGIGSTLVRQMTSRADAEGVGCDLFTFVPRTLALYERLGFQAVKDATLPRTGLRLWAMARPPAARQ